MAAPNTRNWSAWENRQPPVDPAATPFIVTGEVETNNGAIVPELKPAVPQGINPKILILELSLRNTGGVGTTDINYRKARWETKVRQGQYISVEISWEGESVGSATVTVAQ